MAAGELMYKSIMAGYGCAQVPDQQQRAHGQNAGRRTSPHKSRLLPYIFQSGVHLCELLANLWPVHNLAQRAAEVRPRLVHAHLRHHIRVVVCAALCSMVSDDVSKWRCWRLMGRKLHGEALAFRKGAKWRECEKRGYLIRCAEHRDVSSARMCGTASSGRPAGPPWMSASTESAKAITSSGVTFSSGNSYSACTAGWSTLLAAKAKKTPAASAASHVQRCRLQGCVLLLVCMVHRVCQSWQYRTHRR